MRWYIRDVLIYGSHDEMRHLSLESGVNIITGDSQTGKSAIIPIVDYCLGSDSCRVPVGPIREFASWYAIRLQAGKEQILLARPDPGKKKSTADMHIQFGANLPLPRRAELRVNTYKGAVVEELTRRLGMMEGSLARSRFDTVSTEAPSIRDAAFFLFQPQNVIANQEVLFYKIARKPKYAERLKRVFPYFLGAVDFDYFHLRSELDRAKRNLAQLEHQIVELEGRVDADLATARELYVQSVDLGLIPTGDEPAEPELLRKALLAALANERPVAERRAAVAGDAVRIADLVDRSRQVRTEIATLRERLAEVEGLAADATGAVGALGLQAGRLRVVDLLPSDKDSEEAHMCPLCAQSTDGRVPSLGVLRDMQADVSREIGGLSAAPPALQAISDELKEELTSAHRQLLRIEAARVALARGVREEASADEPWIAQERHLGALRFFLGRWRGSQTVPEGLRHEHAVAKRQVTRLRARLEEFDVADRRESALSAINSRMQVLSGRLKVERPGATLWLDVTNLTVVRDSPAGRPERLWEIGGGENHIGYHLCALFALHAFFIARDRPVPSFLFIDQPSQVYFPEQSRSKAKRRTDWDAVRRIYQMIFDTTREQPGLQVVIFDHAYFLDEEFKSAVRRRWREGNKLI